jgi:hypothetical protein
LLPLLWPLAARRKSRLLHPLPWLLSLLLHLLHPHRKRQLLQPTQLPLQLTPLLLQPALLLLQPTQPLLLAPPSRPPPMPLPLPSKRM